MTELEEYPAHVLAKALLQLEGLPRLQATEVLSRKVQQLADETLVTVAEDHTFPQIAAALGITRQAAYQRTQHARHRLGGGS
jgi:hypothetical protein